MLLVVNVPDDGTGEPWVTTATSQEVDVPLVPFCQLRVADVSVTLTTPRFIGVGQFNCDNNKVYPVVCGAGQVEITK